MLELFRSWLTTQLVELGAGEEADDLALHVLAFSQGVATLSNAFADRSYVRREVDRLERSLRERFPDA